MDVQISLSFMQVSSSAVSKPLSFVNVSSRKDQNITKSNPNLCPFSNSIKWHEILTLCCFLTGKKYWGHVKNNEASKNRPLKVIYLLLLCSTQPKNSEDFIFWPLCHTFASLFLTWPIEKLHCLWWMKSRAYIHLLITCTSWNHSLFLG